MLNEVLIFSGTNSDDEDRKLQPGDFRFALNVETDNVDSSNVGAVVNSKGNRLVPVTLPSGTNKVIGSKEDLDSNSCVYFLYNSNGNHSIFRFLSDVNRIDLVMQTSLFNFSLDHRINHINIVDEKLLLWTDGYNPPRQINLDKAIEYNKRRKFNIYWGDSFAAGQYYDTTIFSPTGTVVFTWRTTIQPGLTPADAYGLSQYYVTQVPVTASAIASFTTCGASVEIEMRVIGEYTIQIAQSTVNQSMVVADNFYPVPYDEVFIDRLKQPFHCQPSATYKADNTRKTNLVQNRVFQFATRYIYDDYEKSAISPYSIIPTSGGDCGAIAAITSLNYIEVDFTETRLNDPVFRSNIRGVDILFREHNTGKLKLATTLLPENFGIGLNIFKFYNDGIYSGIPDAEAAKNFDSIPIISGAQEFVNNRVFDSNILEGYDTVCIDADLDVKYKDAGGVRISGIVSIIQPVVPLSGSGYRDGAIDEYRRMPIYNTRNYVGGPTKILFGGIVDSWYEPPYPPYNGSPSFGIQTLSAQECEIKLQGFTVYLAGTNYVGVTKQREITDLNTGLPISMQGSSGIVSTSYEPDYNIVYRITNSDTQFSSSFIQDWEISGVKPGVYSLRIASHKISAIDIDLDYQNTSTRILTEPISSIPSATGVCGSGTTEAIIEVRLDGTVIVRDPVTYNIISTNTGGYCGESFVRDITSPKWNNPAYGVDLYVVDGEGASAPASANLMLDFPRVTKTLATLWNDAIITQYNLQRKTDHNGFTYMWSSLWNPLQVGSTSVTLRLTELINSQSLIFPSGIGCYEVNGYPAIDTTDLFDREYIYFYPTNTFFPDGRTYIEGTVFDASGGVAESVNVALTFHGSTKTDANGRFSISYYADSPTNLQSDILLFSTNGLCSLSASQPNISFSIIINSVNYNNSRRYNSNTPIISYIYSEINSLKRGFDGQYGIVYYDRGNRSTTVNASEKTNIHVLFYTEKDPVTGNFYYSQVPEVSWSIKHLAPDWATHYQWVRTKNLQLNFYLQFVAGKVEYVDIPSSTSPTSPFSTAKYVRIDLNNITTYKESFANSQISYTWQQGDRIRFISSYGTNYFTDYFDYEIQAEDSGFIFIEKDNRIGQLQDGVFFEIYSPRLQTEKKLFYEIGECYNVVRDPRGISFHEGPIQNQDPLNPFSTPAKGVFNSGNAWYRGRVIPFGYSGANIANLFNIDDESISDFYPSKDDNIGRINIEDLDSQQIHREKTVRFSDVYVKESKLNGLSSYSALNYENIQKGEGPVYKLQRSGRVLLTIQRSQVNSLYIEEIVYIDANGNPSLTVSDKVIGTIRPQEMQYGSVHPESVKEYAGTVYWYDVTKGTVIRYSNDGLTPIGDYKMKSFFRNITKDVLRFPIGQIECIGGFDPLNKRYLLSFVKHDNLLNFVNRTCGFSEPSNRWNGDYSFIPESMAMTGMDVITYKDGELWVHDNPVRNNFYGVQYTSKLGAVSNQDSGKVRNFMAISEESNEVWSCPEIEVPANAQFPTGMISRLIKSKFVNKEGVFYAPFLKDMNSPNFATQNEALIGGRDLRGHVLRITLENDSTTPVVLNAINVRYIYSELSKQ